MAGLFAGRGHDGQFVLMAGLKQVLSAIPINSNLTNLLGAGKWHAYPMAYLGGF